MSGLFTTDSIIPIQVKKHNNNVIITHDDKEIKKIHEDDKYFIVLPIGETPPNTSTKLRCSKEQFESIEKLNKPHYYLHYKTNKFKDEGILIGIFDKAI